MKQSEKLTQLLELMQANPELPVIPCVDGDVVSGDEYYCWLGSWGESAVQEFVIGSERTYYREDDISEMNDVLYEHYDPELVDNMTEEETRAAYNALPWKKAIFVDVHQYEEETADVFIMLVQLFAIFNPHELVNITKIVWDKLDRLKDNLDKETAKQEASDAGKK